MPKGPAGAPRPFVKTHLKYTVEVEMPNHIYDNPPKAADVLDMRVNALQADVIRVTKKNIGKVIMAANGLAHPSRHKVVHEEIEEHTPTGTIPENHIRAQWTYVMKGVGIGEYADTSTTSRRAWELHEVLIKGNDEPIRSSSKIREFDSGPLDVKRVQIHTE